MIYANYTGFPKRDYLNRYRIDLLLTHSHPDLGCIFVPSLHPNRPYLHNSLVPKSDDHENSSSSDYISQIRSSHSSLLYSPLWWILNIWAGSKDRCECDRYRLCLLILLLLCTHIIGARLLLFPGEAYHRLPCDVSWAPRQYDTCIPIHYAINSFSLASPSVLYCEIEASLVLIYKRKLNFQILQHSFCHSHPHSGWFSLGIIRGYYADPENSRPLFGALFVLGQLVFNPQRKILTISTLQECVKKTGFKDIKVNPLTERSILLTTKKQNQNVQKLKVC